MTILIFIPRDKEFWYLLTKSLRHVLAADVGDTLERQGHVHRVAGGEVILDALHNQLNQLRVAGDKHGDEEITL